MSYIVPTESSYSTVRLHFIHNYRSIAYDFVRVRKRVTPNKRNSIETKENCERKNHNENCGLIVTFETMDFTTTSMGTPSSEQGHPPSSQNHSFHSVNGAQVNHSTTSSSSTSSQDKKPRAKILTPSGTGTSTEERYDYSESSKVGTNPFLVTTLQDRDENFPSFEDALLTTSGDSIHQNSRNSYIGSINSTNLSISALAALSEHNRHVSKYGIDNSLIQDQEDDDDDDATFPQSLYADPLDAEWERLLQNTSHNSALNVSHISLNQSLQSVPEHLLSDDKIRVTTHRSPDGAENEAIEVMTEVSYSDFLNTSRMIDVLRTPEHVTKHERDDYISSENDGITTRTHRDIHSSSSNQTSEASYSDDSTRNLQKLYFNAMLPPITQQRPFHDSSSMTSTPSRGSKSIENSYTAATHSFSLHNVDLSRISADDDDDDDCGIIRNLDQSFGATSANDNNNIAPSLIDHFDIGIRLDHDQTPSTSNSKSRKTIAREFAETPSRRNEQKWWYDTSKVSNLPPYESDATSTRDPNVRSQTTEHNRRSNHIPNDNDATESKLEMMGLSPISRKAADSAISLLRSSPDWNRTKATAQSHDAFSSYPNPFETEAFPDFLIDSNETSNESDRISRNVVEYEHQLHSNSSDSQLHTSNEDGISPLNSSSEPNNNNDSSNSGIVQNISDTSHHPPNSNVLENSSSSDDHLKKNSLSSISPNSSSEHHITTKPTTTTKSISSYSVTSNDSKWKDHTSLHPPSRNPNTPSQSKQLLSSVGAGTQHAVPQWDDRNDRRKYRTVVPIRVFINEPYHFPNEDDSFMTMRRKSSFLSLPALTRSSNELQKHDRSERSIRSDPR